MKIAVRSNSRLRFVAAAVLAISLFATNLGAGSSGADASSFAPLVKCQSGLNPLGALGSAAVHLPNMVLWPAPVVVRDSFAVHRADWWRWVAFTDSCISVDRGLQVKVPTGALPWMYAASEYQSVSAYPSKIGSGQETTQFTVRLKGANVTGVDGSRGWGYFHTALATADSDWALFMYFHNPQLRAGDNTSVPNGFYAMTGSAGNGYTFHKLPAALLKAAHTYKVVWSPKAVRYYIDGNLVATETKYLPHNRLTVSIWVDNGRYYGLPNLATPLLLVPTFGPTPRDNVLVATGAQIW